MIRFESLFIDEAEHVLQVAEVSVDGKVLTSGQRKVLKLEVCTFDMPMFAKLK